MKIISLPSRHQPQTERGEHFRKRSYHPFGHTSTISHLQRAKLRGKRRFLRVGTKIKALRERKKIEQIL